MAKKFFLLSVLATMCFSVSAIADQGGEINTVDDKGRRQGKWIIFGKDEPHKGYPSDGKIEEGPYLDDRKEGVWIKYHNDGETPRLQGEYHNNRPSGAYTKFYPDGKVRETGVFDRNKYSGQLKRYHENGQLEYEATYNENGKEEGAVKYYYPNGQLEYEYNASNGVAVGDAARYYENGDVKEKITYGTDGAIVDSKPFEPVNPNVQVVDPGASSEQAPLTTAPRTKGAPFKPNGYNKVYNENDEIWQDGEFRNGRLWEGKVYQYDEDGILLKVKVFKNGVYHSDGQL